ncbi:hypothetical protein ACFLZB_04180 [Nanoarchaeota archaeon]
MVTERLEENLGSKKLQERLEAAVLTLNDLHQNLSSLQERGEDADVDQVERILNLKQSFNSVLQDDLRDVGSTTYIKYIVGENDIPGLSDDVLKYSSLTWLACFGKNVAVARKAVEHLAQIPDLETRTQNLKMIAQKGRVDNPSSSGYIKRGAAYKAVEEIAKIGDLDLKISALEYSSTFGQKEAKEKAQKVITSLVYTAFKSQDIADEDKIKVYHFGIRYGDQNAAKKTISGVAKIADQEARNQALKTISEKAVYRPETHRTFIRTLKTIDQESREMICEHISKFAYQNELVGYAQKYLKSPEVLVKKLRNLDE